jgi:hypothetical protein
VASGHPSSRQQARAEPLGVEHLREVGREGKHAALAVLRRPRIEPDFADRKIDMAPLQSQDLARRPPPRDERKRRHPLHVGRQMRSDPLEFLALEEPATNVVLLQQRNVGLAVERAVLDGEAQHTFERDQVSVDGRVRRARVALVDECPHRGVVIMVSASAPNTGRRCFRRRNVKVRSDRFPFSAYSAISASAAPLKSPSNEGVEQGGAAGTAPGPPASVRPIRPRRDPRCAR